MGLLPSPIALVHLPLYSLASCVLTRVIAWHLSTAVRISGKTPGEDGNFYMEGGYRGNLRREEATNAVTLQQQVDDLLRDKAAEQIVVARLQRQIDEQAAELTELTDSLR